MMFTEDSVDSVSLEDEEEDQEDLEQRLYSMIHFDTVDLDQSHVRSGASVEPVANNNDAQIQPDESHQSKSTPGKPDKRKSSANSVSVLTPEPTTSLVSPKPMKDVPALSPREPMQKRETAAKLSKFLKSPDEKRSTSSVRKKPAVLDPYIPLVTHKSPSPKKRVRVVYDSSASDTDSDSDDDLTAMAKAAGLGSSSASCSDSDEDDAELGNATGVEKLDLQVNSHQDGGVVLDCDDLKDFYDITLEDIHRQLPDDGWHVSPEDRSMMVGRYYQNRQINVTCFNCQERGHLSKVCPKPKKIICILCGEKGHNDRKCPNQVCYNCYEIGHIVKDCESTRKWFWDCRRCWMLGHTSKDCPQQWRQFHLTTKVGPLNACFDSTENKKKFCYNCGEGGHFGHECPESDKFACPAQPYVLQYDQLRAAYPPDVIAEYGLQREAARDTHVRWNEGFAIKEARRVPQFAHTSKTQKEKILEGRKRMINSFKTWIKHKTGRDINVVTEEPRADESAEERDEMLKKKLTRVELNRLKKAKKKAKFREKLQEKALALEAKTAVKQAKWGKSKKPGDEHQTSKAGQSQQIENTRKTSKAGELDGTNAKAAFGASTAVAKKSATTKQTWKTTAELPIASASSEEETAASKPVTTTDEARSTIGKTDAFDCAAETGKKSKRAKQKGASKSAIKANESEKSSANRSQAEVSKKGPRKDSMQDTSVLRQDQFNHAVTAPGEDVPGKVQLKDVGEEKDVVVIHETGTGRKTSRNQKRQNAQSGVIILGSPGDKGIQGVSTETLVDKHSNEELPDLFPLQTKKADGILRPIVVLDRLEETESNTSRAKRTRGKGKNIEAGADKERETSVIEILSSDSEEKQCTPKREKKKKKKRDQEREALNEFAGDNSSQETTQRKRVKSKKAPSEKDLSNETETTKSKRKKQKKNSFVLLEADEDLEPDDISSTGRSKKSKKKPDAQVLEKEEATVSTRSGKRIKPKTKEGNTQEETLGVAEETTITVLKKKKHKKKVVADTEPEEEIPKSKMRKVTKLQAQDTETNTHNGCVGKKRKGVDIESRDTNGGTLSNEADETAVGKKKKKKQQQQEPEVSEVSPSVTKKRKKKKTTQAIQENSDIEATEIKEDCVATSAAKQKKKKRNNKVLEVSPASVDLEESALKTNGDLNNSVKQKKKRYKERQEQFEQEPAELSLDKLEKSAGDEYVSTKERKKKKSKNECEFTEVAESTQECNENEKQSGKKKKKKKSKVQQNDEEVEPDEEVRKVEKKKVKEVSVGVKCEPGDGSSGVNKLNEEAEKTSKKKRQSDERRFPGDTQETHERLEKNDTQGTVKRKQEESPTTPPQMKKLKSDRPSTTTSITDVPAPAKKEVREMGVNTDETLESLPWAIVRSPSQPSAFTESGMNLQFGDQDERCSVRCQATSTKTEESSISRAGRNRVSENSRRAGEREDHWERNRAADVRRFSHGHREYPIKSSRSEGRNRDERRDSRGCRIERHRDSTSRHERARSESRHDGRRSYSDRKYSPRLESRARSPRDRDERRQGSRCSSRASLDSERASSRRSESGRSEVSRRTRRSASPALPAASSSDSSSKSADTAVPKPPAQTLNISENEAQSESQPQSAPKSFWTREPGADPSDQRSSVQPLMFRHSRWDQPPPHLNNMEAAHGWHSPEIWFDPRSMGMGTPSHPMFGRGFSHPNPYFGPPPGFGPPPRWNMTPHGPRWRSQRGFVSSWQ